MEAFVRSYAVNLSAGGMFIATREPPAVGTVLRFEVVLADDRPVLRGEGQVVWTAGADQPGPPTGSGPASSLAAPAGEPLAGLGVRFGRLDAKSRAVVARVLAYKAAHANQFFTQVPDPYAAPASRPGSRSEVAASPHSAPSAPSLKAEPTPALHAQPAPTLHAEPAPALHFEPARTLHSETAPTLHSESAPTLHSKPASPLHSKSTPPLHSQSASLHPEPAAPVAGESPSSLPELSPSRSSPSAMLALPAVPSPEADAEEEAALQLLLQPISSAPLPTTDAARLLDELLDRRPS